MAKLVCQAGPKAGHEYPINKDRVVFGRLSECDVVIPDAKASREHFTIHRYNHLCSIIDLKSRNGTRVNNNKIREHLLDFGDRIKVGQCEYLYVKEAGDKDLDDLLTKYQLEEKIGEGGMGIVYRATQKSMDRVVALKILSPRHAQKQQFIDQFIEEARSAGSLNHPNIIQVHDVGTENDIHYFSMEFVDGATCMRMLKQDGPMNASAAMEIIRQTAKALEYAHGQHIIHRDIKPDNIMVTSDDVVKLADLGISKSAEDLEKDGDRTIVGTPHYISPEVAKGDKADYRLDLYSLGASAYHLLSGRTPFQGSDPADLLKAHVTQAPQPLGDLVPSLPKPIIELVDKLMAKNPDNRPQSATEVVALIENLQNSLGLQRQQTNGETLLLRKLADGEARSSGSLSSVDDPSVVTSGSLSEVQVSFNKHLPLILIALFILLVAAVAWKVAADGDGEQADSSGNGPQITIPSTGSTQSTDPDPDSTPDDNAVDPGEAQRERELMSRIDDLRRDAMGAKNLAALSAVNQALTAIQSEQHTNRTRSRMQALQKTIADRSDSLRQLEAERQFSTLKSEIFQLMDQKEYDQALQQVSSFITKQGEYAPSNATVLRRDIQNRRTEYIESLQRSVKSFLQREDEDALRKLRDELPDSMTASDIANDISTALRTLADARLKQQQAIIEEARTALAGWELSTVKELYRQHRDGLGTTPNGERFDELNNNASGLIDMIATVDRGLKPQKRFQGRLHFLHSPHLLGADRVGILAKLDGGDVTVRWSDINDAAMDQIFELAAPDKAQAYKDLLTSRVQLTEGQ